MPTVNPAYRSWWTAIKALDLKKVGALLARGANPDVPEDSAFRDTALDHLVSKVTLAQRGIAARLAGLLLEAGADPFRRARSGEPNAFEIAMRTQDSVLMARAMVNHINWRERSPALGHKALLLAVQFHPQLVVPLLDRGAQPQLDGKTSVLGEALGRGPVDLVAALLDRGVGLSATQQRAGADPYTLVVKGGARLAETEAQLHERRLAIVNLLHGRRTYMPANARERLVGLAVKNRCDWPLIERFIELGANPNGRTLKGLTALHLAVEGPGGYPYVDRLLALGLDPSAPDDGGQTPLQRVLGKARQGSHENRARAMLARLETHALTTTLADEGLGDALSMNGTRRRL